MQWSLLAAPVALVVMWLALVVTLAVMRPKGLVREGLRILPDTLRLLRRMAGDRSLSRALRLRLWITLAYLASPIDLIPDFVPGIGYADDVIVVAAVLRTVMRQAPPGTLSAHWSGTEDGLRALQRLAGVAGGGARRP